ADQEAMARSGEILRPWPEADEKPAFQHGHAHQHEAQYLQPGIVQARQPPAGQMRRLVRDDP
ncbi:hypothetical protein, partial [Sphingomonas sp.]|uniref:hypothetical protein n=1 Tax=Sphingomonas sp. TaxID=28214 RepID=UPI0035A8F344